MRRKTEAGIYSTVFILLSLAALPLGSGFIGGTHESDTGSAKRNTLRQFNIESNSNTPMLSRVSSISRSTLPTNFA
jgi:hypothetical protein